MSNSILSPTSSQVNISQRPAIGEQCLLHGRASKVRVRLAANPDHKYPLKTEYRSVRYELPRYAYYVGYRTVHEGITDIEVEYGDYGTVLSKFISFKRKASYCVWLFIWNDKSSPFPVYPEDVARLGGAE